jgi:hypothetical protein
MIETLKPNEVNYCSQVRTNNIESKYYKNSEFKLSVYIQTILNYFLNNKLVHVRNHWEIPNFTVTEVLVIIGREKNNI